MPYNNTQKPDDDAARIKELWLDYKAKPTKKKQRVLMDRYDYIPRSIAYQFARKKPALLDVEDLIQAGRMGLMQAMDRYDPEKQVKFNTYATIRVRGAILDQINNVDWTPRPIREAIKKVIRAIEASGQGLSLSDDNNIDVNKIVALVPDMKPEDVELAIRQMQKTYISHIDNESMGAVDLTVVGGSRDYSTLYAVMNTVLELRERQIIELKFFGGYKDYEITRYLKITQHQLNNIEHEALAKLARNLNPDLL